MGGLSNIKILYPTFSLPSICPHHCQYLPKSLRAFMCSCDHTGFRACKLLFELGGSESYLLENTIPVTQRLAVPKGWIEAWRKRPRFNSLELLVNIQDLGRSKRGYCRRSIRKTLEGRPSFHCLSCRAVAIGPAFLACHFGCNNSQGRKLSQ
jgi:hypothetical protein